MDLSVTSNPGNFTSEAPHQNNSNASKCNLQPDNWTYTVIPVYILLIAVVGIVLNLFVLMVFCLHKKACNVPEVYLSNLAAADLLLVCCLPFWAVNVSKKFNWPFGWFLCKVVNAGISLNVYCSIYFLVLVCIDRYLALVHPLTRERIRRTFYAKVGCLLVWLLGFLLSVPVLVYREVKIKKNGNHTCYLNYPNIPMNLLFEILLFIFSFFIPISILSFCTLKIIKALRNRLAEGVNVQKMDNKATTLVLVVLLAFLICWVPFHLMKIPEMLRLIKFLKQCYLLQLHHICQQIFTYFAFFNSVLNPILYVIVGKNFRKKVMELFKQWRHDRTSTVSFSHTASSYFARKS
ncbi:B2 bradykinin receptor-like [Melanotaenia boesemani]|uniref:B2 bradykinin receptor-like n=1 Tax=Melanotaenia boesemani TaxID=1250792 RepID=UPI001C043977|nr:B2 bradykinin receptor-like [Melanotaenia boesemani]